MRIVCIPYFFRKLGKMSKNLSSAAVVIGALRVNRIYVQLTLVYKFMVKGPAFLLRAFSCLNKKN